MNLKYIAFSLLILLLGFTSKAQIIINEGSNRNYSSIIDEDGEFPDWIELYNAGNDTIDLYNYSLTDNALNPTKWVFPHVNMIAGEYKVIFCSGKDRKPVSGSVNVINTGTFSATVGWNTHIFSNPFYWDGVSNVIINTCSFSSLGYISNSVFNQSITSFPSTVFNSQDGSPASCYATYGSVSNLRPNIKLNGLVIGTGTAQNSPTDYPAPYGNWYWGARNQMLYLASELSAAGLTAGLIDSMAFDVASTDAVVYDYIDINMKLVNTNEISSQFETNNPNNFLHTNFKITGNGEEVFLFNSSQQFLNSLNVACQNLNNSNGLFPDGSANASLFETATPVASNNTSLTFLSYLLPVTLSVPAGIYNSVVNVSINNPNSIASEIYYTLDGSDPTTTSTLYTGTPLNISFSRVLKAKAFQTGFLASPLTAASYLLGISHVTPVLSVITDNNNLYGPDGIFDNWGSDWQKQSYAEYFNDNNQLVFSQNAAMQIDGGAGGSRSHPQHSFRLELDNDVMGDGTVNYNIIPNRPTRNKFSRIYLRNGSNQFLTLPYKDACQVRLMCEETNNYYSAWRPISVYINGSYFGLYELREKFDTEYFKTYDDADIDSQSILSSSYWYGGSLRAVEGSVDSFYASYNSFNNLSTADTAYWTNADKYFDMTYYNDYIIGQSWMGNVDWPGNNIKLYRSNQSDNRWRYALIDQELAMAPNGWTDCYFDNIEYLQNQDPNNPYINIWLKGMQNDRFKNYFINRFADVMNTSYRNDRLIAVENDMYNQTVIEMQKEYARWGDANNINGQMNDFNNNHLVFQDQLTLRTPVVRDNIENRFGLPRQVDVTLDVLPLGSGKIHISTITPDTYPWEGVYFDGIPVKIEAIANPGFQFLHWGNNALLNDTLNIVFNDTLQANEINFTAYFLADFNSSPSISTSNYTLYPNPAINNLYLLNKGAKKSTSDFYQIIDMNGRVIKQENISIANQQSIDISKLTASVYQLKVLNDKGLVRQFRFVKMGE
jgi:hypothetical protein